MDGFRESNIQETLRYLKEHFKGAKVVHTSDSRHMREEFVASDGLHQYRLRVPQDFLSDQPSEHLRLLLDVYDMADVMREVSPEVLVLSDEGLRLEED